MVLLMTLMCVLQYGVKIAVLSKAKLSLSPENSKASEIS